MKVFISHKREDSELARTICEVLANRGVPTYLDVQDPQIDPDHVGITDYIIDKIGGCTHLLPVVTDVTVRSWWVPFEIGIATEKRIPIATFIQARVEIPAFLRTWPFLQNGPDLVKFADLAMRRENIQRFDERYAKKSLGERSVSARGFESELKGLLGQ